MKKTCFILVCVLVLAGCEKELPASGDGGYEPGMVADGKWDAENNPRSVMFRMTGDWQSPVFSRAAAVSESDMTDVWVFDYMGSELLQVVRQESATAGDTFGSPTLPLVYGSHTLCFVTSRGVSPTVSGQVITWSNVRDTFWKSLAVEVNEDMPSSVAVPMDRVVTRLRVTVVDEVPEGLAEIVVRPSAWHYGLDVRTGAPADSRDEERSVAVPASYAGTQGTLVVSLFGMSTTSEWTADVEVFARDADDNILGTATITDAPFAANRSTEYSGRLFSGDGGFSLSLNDEWSDPWTGAW